MRVLLLEYYSTVRTEDTVAKGARDSMDEGDVLFRFLCCQCIIMFLGSLPDNYCVCFQCPSVLGAFLAVAYVKLLTQSRVLQPCDS